MSHHRPRAWFGSVRCAVGPAVAAACICAGAAHAQQHNPYFIDNNNQGEMDFSVALSDNDLLTFRAAGPGGNGMFVLQPSSPPIAGGTVLTIRGYDFGSSSMSPPSMNSAGALAFTDLDTDGSPPRPAMFTRAPGGTVLTIDRGSLEAALRR